MGVDHLAGNGITRIGYVSIPTHIETGARRLAGFKAAVAARGLEARIVDGGIRLATGFRAAERLIREWPAMDGMIMGKKMVTPGALRALKAEKRRGPEDGAGSRHCGAVPWRSLRGNPRPAGRKKGRPDSEAADYAIVLIKKSIPRS